MGLCGSRVVKNEDQAPVNKIESKKPSTKKQVYEAVGPDGYELVQDVGVSGSNDYIKLLRNKRTKELVAGKFVGTSTKEGVPRGIEREIVNHRGLIHPNIVRFYEVLIYDDALGIVSEFPAGGCLSDSLVQNGPVTEGQAKTLFRQLLSGMQYCHEKKIWHRDLRVQNMYLDESDGQPILKISGFGYSKSEIFDSNPRTKSLTAPLNTPPEQIKGAGHPGAAYDGSKVDIWGAGIILYVMLTGVQPFEDPVHPGVMNRVAMNKINNCSFNFPSDIQLTRECKDFIGRIFVENPQDRPSIADMLQMPWMTGVSAMRSSAVVVESRQDETQIADVVERARKRRGNRTANGSRLPRLDPELRLPAGPPHQSSGSRRPAPATINPREVDGIAEYRTNTAPVYGQS